MITDDSKFVGLLHLGESSLNSSLDEIIEQKEPELLQDWFGYELAKDIQSATPSTEAQALINGFEYTNSNGDLAQATGLDEILPYFIFFYYVRENQTSNSPIGGLSELAENSVRAMPTMKLVTNYNRGVELINEVIEYVGENDDVYTSFVFNGYCKHITTLGI